MSDPTGPASTPSLRFGILGIAASGLTAQRIRMETIATNIANASTTRTEGGGPYRRRVVEMVPGAGAFESALRPDGAITGDPLQTDTPTGDRALGVRVAAVTEDGRSGPRVYEPGHPHADADGYVQYPNVNLTEESVDLMDARRLFEANASVFQVAKAMLRRAMDI